MRPTDDLYGFKSASSALNARERSIILSWGVEVRAGCDGCGFEEEGIGACASKEDGSLEEEDEGFRGKQSQVLAQEEKIFEEKVAERVLCEKRKMEEYRRVKLRKLSRLRFI